MGTEGPAKAILGISALYHDAAACLVDDERIVAAAQEERFTRKKHDPVFPDSAIAYCLEEAGLQPEELTHVAFYEKPLLRFDRLMETYLRFAPMGLRSFLRAFGALVNEKLRVPGTMDRALGGRYEGPFYFPRHHEAHAASAFFPSPFERAAIVTVDGVGEWTTTSIGVGEGNRIELLREIRFPHSLGLLYSAFTYYTGFRVNSGEYKLMGLAPYGRPKYRDVILKELLDLKDDGSFRLNMRYFDYCTGMSMTNARFHALFDGPPRAPESPIEERHMDLAASVQAATEEVMLKLAAEAKKVTGADHLCLAGGVALNCVANGRILREGPFDDVWIQPASGDAGGALGAALFVRHQVLGAPRPDPGGKDTQQGSLLGPEFGPASIEKLLASHGAPYRRIDDEQELFRETVDHMEAGRVIGWFQGRMEYGPRALGSRSILADPRSEEMQARVNLKIKYRESFRPFAPMVLDERKHEYFDLDRSSPYMLLVAPVAKQQWLECDEAGAGHYMKRLYLKRSLIPAVTHVDYSARIQTVDAERNPRMHGLLSTWNERTGCGVVLNTSFNVRGEPIVCKPKDAYACFMRTEMDVLVMGDYILLKEEQPAYQGELQEFEAD